jgi:hypothetical protein
VLPSGSVTSIQVGPAAATTRLPNVACTSCWPTAKLPLALYGTGCELSGVSLGAGGGTSTLRRAARIARRCSGPRWYSATSAMRASSSSSIAVSASQMFALSFAPTAHATARAASGTR